MGRVLITGTAGCDGSLLVVRPLALGCEVVEADSFIGTYPRECELHNLERAASAVGFRLVEGNYHDYHVVIHGTSELPGCAKETTHPNCATNGGLLRAKLRTDSSYDATCYARLRNLGSSVEECLATIDELRVRYAVLRHQMVNRYP